MYCNRGPHSIARLMHLSYKQKSAGSNPAGRTFSTTHLGLWRSQVAHRAFNPMVVGSNPARPSISSKGKQRSE